jgi:hypothetical protein
LPELLLDFTAGWIFRQQTQPILYRSLAGPAGKHEETETTDDRPTGRTRAVLSVKQRPHPLSADKWKRWTGGEPWRTNCWTSHRPVSGPGAVSGPDGRGRRSRRSRDLPLTRASGDRQPSAGPPPSATRRGTMAGAGCTRGLSARHRATTCLPPERGTRWCGPATMSRARHGRPFVRLASGWSSYLANAFGCAWRVSVRTEPSSVRHIFS